MAVLETKNMVLTKKLGNVLYKLAVQTNSDMVYVKSGYTLTQLIDDFATAIQENANGIAGLDETFKELISSDGDTFGTFKEIYDYIGTKDDPSKTIVDMINSRVLSEDGKGLSTNDLTNALKERIENGYTSDEIDKKLNSLSEEFQEKLERFIVVDNNETAPDNLMDNGFWYQIQSVD